MLKTNLINENLILGGTGMLGHQLINACIERELNWFALARQTQKL